MEPDPICRDVYVLGPHYHPASVATERTPFVSLYQKVDFYLYFGGVRQGDIARSASAVNCTRLLLMSAKVCHFQNTNTRTVNLKVCNPYTLIRLENVVWIS